MQRMSSPATPPPTDQDLLGSLGRKVRQAREARGESRRQLAARAQLSERYLAALEAGKGNISILRLRNLLLALGLQWAEVLNGDGVAAPGAPEQRRDALRRAVLARLEERSAEEMREVQAWLASRFPGARPVVALLGLRGAGKSSVGRRLARRLRVGFFELDDLVEEAAGLRLEQVFDLLGPARYRELEFEALRRFLRRREGGVLATGGGIVTAPSTFALLRQRCLTVWLRATPEEHWERVVRQGDRRPMQGKPAAMQELRALLAAREPLYAQAQITCDTRGVGIEAATRRLAGTLGPVPRGWARRQRPVSRQLARSK